jgi:biotin carboxyl carrier protein
MARSLGKAAAMKYIAAINGQEYLVDILDQEHVSIDGTEYKIDFKGVSGQPVYSLLLNGQSYEAQVYDSEEEWQVLLGGRLYSVLVEDERERRLRTTLGARASDTGEFQLRSPMPGLVIALPVKEGQLVRKGDVLLILESMKMQNELKAPRDGTIARIRVKVGDSVEQKQVLLSVV